MDGFSQATLQSQTQKQSQKQVQKLSQMQIQALQFLSLNTQDLKQEIYKALNENPALEIVQKKSSNDSLQNSVYDMSFEPKDKYLSDEGNLKFGSSYDSDRLQQTLEAQEDSSETLQSHLLHQLNASKISEFEYEISKKLIYNLDKNGFYGSQLAPETFLPSRTKENFEILEKCISRIQRMDPVGTCCKTPEESLFVQAKCDVNCPPLAIFILDGHLEFINPPEPQTVYQKLKNFQKEYHKKLFSSKLLLDKLSYDVHDVEKSINYILRLNLHPAQGYIKDTLSNFEQPDIVLKVEKKTGYRTEDNFANGIVCGDDNCHFQIKYSCGDLPELQISPDFSFDTENVQKALSLINNLRYRESTIVLQGCAIVKAQKDFFLYGTGHLHTFTRRQLASELRIHESTVSRTSSNKNSKYMQTDWGLFPLSYFFTSGVKTFDGQHEVSSEKIVSIIEQILKENKGVKISDSNLTRILNEKGIKIARRTVSKYRLRSGIKNSYNRD